MFLCLMMMLGIGWAEVPLAQSYPECGEPDRPDLCPSDLDEDWSYIGYIPEKSRESIRDAELELGSGTSVDLAWRTTLGDWEVVLAVADSGISWYETQLVNKVYLNDGELPVPWDALDEEADSHDANGDGVFNIEDYASDSRVDITAGVDTADHLLDPSDLIYTFSDGVDEDENGYEDDIAGWDFFGRDNDAYSDFDSGFGTHGTEVMEGAAAEGGDQENGNIGVCPNCSILPIRIGDTFITDGSRVAEGIAFGVDSGASVLGMAVGALSSPDVVGEAIEYAIDMDMVIVAAAGDENSYHHNLPAMLNNILYVHSIIHNTGDDDDEVYSYMNTWNCNNFGARMDFVAPANACATGAVAHITGGVGLLMSAAEAAGYSLTVGEVRQIFIQTVDDVWLTEDEVSESKAYPSEEGWDPFYGYGRVNVGAAVDLVTAGEIPPWISIESPRWFATLDPAQTPDVEVSAHISAERSSGFTYVVEVGTGNSPTDWDIVAQGAGVGAETLSWTLDGGSLVTSKAASEPTYFEGILDRLDRVNEPAITVRVTATDSDGLQGEERKTFFLYEDPDALDGFPIDLGESGESSPILADLDGDGVFEILLGTAGGRVSAWHGSGELVPGWPVTTESDPMLGGHSGSPSSELGAISEIREGVLATVAVGDIDGDGEPEVVAAGLGGGVYAWHADGTPVHGFPVWTIGRSPEEFDNNHTYDQGFAGAPVLVDLDDDGDYEIIAAAMDSRLYVMEGNGDDWGPYPVEICHPDLCGTVGSRIITSPAVGDVDGDGDLEILFGSNEGASDGAESVAHLIDAATGESEDGWPHAEAGLVNESMLLPMVGEGHPSSLALADIDGDGDLEISNPIMLGMTDLMHHDTSTAVELTYYGMEYGEGSNAGDVPALLQMNTSPAFGDMDGDGTPDLILGGVSSYWLITLAMSHHVDYQQAVAAWSGSTGEFLEGWPRQIEDVQFMTAGAVADLSGDGRAEAVFGSGGYLLHAWDASGAEPDGWPKFTGNWILGGAAVGDITGDGYLEVVAVTREGQLFAWTTDGPADQEVQWASIQHDPQNTGNFEMPLVQQEGPVLMDEAGGCCRSGNKQAGVWLLFPLGLGFLRRRGSS